MVFLVFFLGFCSTTGLESFFLRPEKFPKDFLSVVMYAFFFSAECKNPEVAYKIYYAFVGRGGRSGHVLGN